jgi:hypothetical protein
VGVVLAQPTHRPSIGDSAGYLTLKDVKHIADSHLVFKPVILETTDPALCNKLDTVKTFFRSGKKVFIYRIKPESPRTELRFHDTCEAVYFGLRRRLPDLQGKTIREAKETLRMLDFRLGHADSLADSVVIGDQDPKPGTSLWTCQTIGADLNGVVNVSPRKGKHVVTKGRGGSPSSSEHHANVPVWQLLVDIALVLSIVPIVLLLLRMRARLSALEAPHASLDEDEVRLIHNIFDPTLRGLQETVKSAVRHRNDYDRFLTQYDKNNDELHQRVEAIERGLTASGTRLRSETVGQAGWAEFTQQRGHDQPTPRPSAADPVTQAIELYNQGLAHGRPEDFLSAYSTAILEIERESEGAGAAFQKRGATVTLKPGESGSFMLVQVASRGLLFPIYGANKHYLIDILACFDEEKSKAAIKDRLVERLREPAEVTPVKGAWELKKKGLIVTVAG